MTGFRKVAPRTQSLGSSPYYSVLLPPGAPPGGSRRRQDRAFVSCFYYNSIQDRYLGAIRGKLPGGGMYTGLCQFSVSRDITSKPECIQ
jgi:hypothetical protein